MRRPFSGPEWGFEVKFDGFRPLAKWGRAGTRLKSRQGRDITGWFPEIAIPPAFKFACCETRSEV